MDREIASSKDIAAAEFSVREAKLRQEMELAAVQHSNEVQALRSEIASGKDRLETAQREASAARDEFEEKLRRQRAKNDELEGRQSALQRELNVTTRDVASKEFRVEKLTAEVEELRDKLARADEVGCGVA